MSAFYGITIYMYWKDHSPPHFHAFYGGNEAQVCISNSALLAGSLQATAARLIAEWAALHRDELLANWNRAQAQEPLLPIEGLR